MSLKETELREKWRKLSIEEKSKWNGYPGFRQGIYFDKSSAFLPNKLRRETVDTK
jgi:hypothetical protein